jgi:hypothetical protein
MLLSPSAENCDGVRLCGKNAAAAAAAAAAKQNTIPRQLVQNLRLVHHRRFAQVETEKRF